MSPQKEQLGRQKPPRDFSRYLPLQSWGLIQDMTGFSRAWLLLQCAHRAIAMTTVNWLAVELVDCLLA